MQTELTAAKMREIGEAVTTPLSDKGGKTLILENESIDFYQFARNHWPALIAAVEERDMVAETLYMRKDAVLIKEDIEQILQERKDAQEQAARVPGLEAEVQRWLAHANRLQADNLALQWQLADLESEVERLESRMMNMKHDYEYRIAELER